MRIAVRFGLELPAVRGRGWDAAEWIVINQLLDRRMIATDRALRVATVWNTFGP